MSVTYEVRIEEDGSVWVKLDEMIHIFDEMKNDKENHIKKIGEFASYILMAFKNKAMNEV